jgi:hypothetical protein
MPANALLQQRKTTRRTMTMEGRKNRPRFCIACGAALQLQAAGSGGAQEAAIRSAIPEAASAATEQSFSVA